MLDNHVQNEWYIFFQFENLKNTKNLKCEKLKCEYSWHCKVVHVNIREAKCRCVFCSYLHTCSLLAVLIVLLQLVFSMEAFQKKICKSHWG